MEKMRLLNELTSQMWVIIAFYVAVLLFVLADLWSGIRKAKQRGEYRSSYGLRKTVTKITNYYNLMIVLTIMDILIMTLLVRSRIGLPVFPYLSLIGALIIGIIECKSIYEKADDKERAKANEAISLLAEVIKNKEDIGETLQGVIDKSKSKHATDHSTTTK